MITTHQVNDDALTARGIQGESKQVVLGLLEDMQSLLPKEASVLEQQAEVRRALLEILENRLLSAVFQPIIHLNNGALIGYEALIRGPENSQFQSPLKLFAAAQENNLGPALEKLCREVILSRFAEQDLPGKLFLNISPEGLLDAKVDFFEILKFCEKISLDPHRIILELTENQATHDYHQMREVLQRCRKYGFQIAIDDLGEGFSSLRLWSEIKPEFVKIDMHFIQGIDKDPVKLQFVQSIQLIAAKSGTITIAEGIETEQELFISQEIGVACGQGYYIARPTSLPAEAIANRIAESLKQRASLSEPKNTRGFNFPTALKLLRIAPVVTPSTTTNQVYQMFVDDPSLEVLAAIDDGVPVGLINRFHLFDRLARPFQWELFGKKPCKAFITPDPLIVDKNTSLQDLSMKIVEAAAHHLADGFVITDQGQYIGLGTSQDVMREITQMQINAARYANPLTQLPGNVVINEEIDKLVAKGREFYVCYCDIDHFKPYNDVYGYRRGDDVIQLTSNILSRHCVTGTDFLGHVGGDDFIVLFQSADWEARCQKILGAFSSSVRDFYTDADVAQGGYITEDRQGNKVFHPLVTLSLGVVKVEAGRNYSNYQISAAAASAKRQAKAITGNSLFVERRAVR